MARAALIVGIDYYLDKTLRLKNCVDDAYEMKNSLKYHSDDSANFECHLMTATSDLDRVDAAALSNAVREFFRQDAEVLFFYFAGHGWPGVGGATVLAATDNTVGQGLSLQAILNEANSSPARNRVVVLDCCHAGGFDAHGQWPAVNNGVTLLAACSRDQFAIEDPAKGGGVVTSLLCDGLRGQAADILGNVTAASLYGHVDRSLSFFDYQRPVFMTHVHNFLSLRQCQPLVTPPDLRQISTLFPCRDHQFRLDPTYEPELKGRDPGMPPPDPTNVAKFTLLQTFNRCGLVKPSEGSMWHSAMHTRDGGKTWTGFCYLTVQGEFYRKLASERKL